MNNGMKRAVPRHRKMCRTSAHRCEKIEETKTRREGKESCKETEEEQEDQDQLIKE